MNNVILMVADAVGESKSVVDEGQVQPERLDRWHFTELVSLCVVRATGLPTLPRGDITVDGLSHVAISDGMWRLHEGWLPELGERLTDDVWAVSAPLSMGYLSSGIVLMELGKFNMVGGLDKRVKSFGWERLLGRAIHKAGGQTASFDSDFVTPLKHEKRDDAVGERYYDMIADLRVVES